MTPEQIKRMARWLAKLEPKFFYFLSVFDTQIGESIGWRLRCVYSQKIVLEFFNCIGVSQLYLYDACSRAAVARGWRTEVHNLPYAKICTGHVTGIKFATEYPVHHEGFALADALIQAHGVTDWQTRDPNGGEA